MQCEKVKLVAARCQFEGPLPRTSYCCIRTCPYVFEMAHDKPKSGERMQFMFLVIYNFDPRFGSVTLRCTLSPLFQIM
jgi:hypothetical protein